MESARPDRVRGLPSIEVRMLGPLTIRREGVTLPLPASRKVRGLLAYLSLSPRAVARSQLCELLWDVPNDPRGELRWSLSKIRGLIDANGQRRVETQADAIRLDLADCFVDAIEVARRLSRNGCRSSPRCSPAIFFRAWRSTATRPSTAGSLHSGAASAAITRHCSSSLSKACPTIWHSDTWRSGWFSRHLTNACTNSC